MNTPKDTIGLASDHAGYELKVHLAAYLERKGYACRDFGCAGTDSCDYPDFAHPLALAVESEKLPFGLAICGTGQGMAMTLNKHQGIRAALCWQPEIAHLARAHNNANVLVLPGRFMTPTEAESIVDEFLRTPFAGGRHLRRIGKIPC